MTMGQISSLSHQLCPASSGQSERRPAGAGRSPVSAAGGATGGICWTGMITVQELLMWLLASELVICCLYESLYWAI